MGELSTLPQVKSYICLGKPHQVKMKERVLKCVIALCCAILIQSSCAQIS